MDVCADMAILAFMKKIQLSALELSLVIEGGDARNAFDRTVDVARHIEQLGYKRIWLAEHHNMEFVASSSPAVLIGHVAGHTQSIRVGSGGVMLPNHAPLSVAEQFGTLETLYPGRIDLGLGRAPGTDQATALALRRNNLQTPHHFPAEIREIQAYFSSDNRHARVRAFPAEGREVPIYVLGSSTDSAFLAAEMGLPYAFAAHFAPAHFGRAIEIYRRNFKASKWLERPYLIACVNVVAADTDEEAHELASSMYRMFIGIITNRRQPLQPPVPEMTAYWNDELRAAVQQMTAYSFIGSRETLTPDLETFIEETGIDELMTTSNIYDQQARLKSLTILREIIPRT